MAYPRSLRSRDFKFGRRTGGNITLSSTTWAAIDTALNFTLKAQVGDTIEASISAYWSNEANRGVLDPHTLVSGSPVNRFSDGGTYSASAGEGVSGWLGLASVNQTICGAVHYVVQSGDLSSGFVTIQLMGRITAAGSKVLIATTTNVMEFCVKNIGPQDPN